MGKQSVFPFFWCLPVYIFFMLLSRKQFSSNIISPQSKQMKRGFHHSHYKCPKHKDIYTLGPNLKFWRLTASWIKNGYGKNQIVNLTQDSTVNFYGESTGVTGTNYRRDCELSRHPNWYTVYNPKLNFVSQTKLPISNWIFASYFPNSLGYSGNLGVNVFHITKVVFHVFYLHIGYIFQVTSFHIIPTTMTPE